MTTLTPKKIKEKVIISLDNTITNTYHLASLLLCLKIQSSLLKLSSSKDDEHQVTQLLHLLNPVCYSQLSLKIDVPTSHTDDR